MDYLVRATFIIFASVLLCRFIVSEFTFKSINILFMYPIDRKKLMVAKPGNLLHLAPLRLCRSALPCWECS
ncbi:UNVERIFIED_CONTAM: hypothetical protein ABIC26_000899 [Paenibacillus sp. PvR008]